MFIAEAWRMSCFFLSLYRTLFNTGILKIINKQVGDLQDLQGKTKNPPSQHTVAAAAHLFHLLFLPRYKGRWNPPSFLPPHLRTGAVQVFVQNPMEAFHGWMKLPVLNQRIQWEGKEKFNLRDRCNPPTPDNIFTMGVRVAWDTGEFCRGGEKRISQSYSSFSPACETHSCPSSTRESGELWWGCQEFSREGGMQRGMRGGWQNNVRERIAAWASAEEDRRW